ISTARFSTCSPTRYRSPARWLADHHACPTGQDRASFAWLGRYGPASPPIPASPNARHRTRWNSADMAFGVLIVDDNPLFLEAARDLLEQGGLRVVGVATTSAAALQQAQQLRPGVVLVDIVLGGESGFELARRLASQHPDGGP